MESFKSGFEERKKESQLIIDMIRSLESETGSIKKTAILKSTAIMILYNTVESTLYNALQMIHEKLILCNFSLLCEKHRELYIEGHFGTLSNVSKIKIKLEQLLDEKLTFPNIDKLQKNIFSGNVDRQLFNEICKKYNIPYCISKKYGQSFLKVKDIRNSLGHGNQSFSEACRGITLRDIEKCHKDIFASLEIFVTRLEYYIAQL